VANREATEAPTDKRKKEARKEGRIARSNDLTGWVCLLVGFALIPGVAAREISVFRNAFDLVGADSSGDTQLASILGYTLWHGFLGALPLLGGVWLAAFSGTLAQVGFVLAPKALKPKAERLSPAKNIKRMVGIRGFVELFKQVVRAAIIAYLCWGVVKTVSVNLVGNGPPEAISGVTYVFHELGNVVKRCAGALIAVSLLDYGYQKWQLRKDMRMTKQEIRDEMRQSEGDPLIKQRIRMLQREAARRRMIADVAGATTVLVNPTQIAVAIRYRPGVDNAPVIVAKGRGAVARKIRETAIANNVTVIRAVSLARALERSCDVGDEVPSQLFEAVARVLAFLARVSRQAMWADTVDLPASWTVVVPSVPRRRRRRA
jgi:flagellar biosynthetic protein FlhB